MSSEWSSTKADNTKMYQQCFSHKHTHYSNENEQFLHTTKDTCTSNTVVVVARSIVCHSLSFEHQEVLDNLPTFFKFCADHSQFILGQVHSASLSVLSKNFKHFELREALQPQCDKTDRKSSHTSLKVVHKHRSKIKMQYLARLCMHLLVTQHFGLVWFMSLHMVAGWCILQLQTHQQLLLYCRHWF